MVLGFVIGNRVALLRERIRSRRPRIPIPKFILFEYAGVEIQPPESAPAPPRTPVRFEPPLARHPDRFFSVTITLVHGTFLTPFARRRFLEGNFFEEGIKRAFPRRNVQIHKFEWTGWNSHRARLNAGDALRHQLATDDGNPVNHFVIAHSHGETLASYALRDPALQSRFGGLICLGTPLLLTRARSWKPLQIIFNSTLEIFGVCLLVSLAYGNAFRVIDVLCATFQVPADDPGSWVILFFIVMSTLMGAITLLSPWCRKIYVFLSATIKAQQTRCTQLLGTAFHPTVPLLCIFNGSDEARRWLKRLSQVAGLPERVISRVPLVRSLLLVTACLVPLGFMLHWWPDIRSHAVEPHPKQMPSFIRSRYDFYLLITSTPVGAAISNLVTSTASAALIAAGIFLATEIFLLLLLVISQKVLIGSLFSLGSLSWYDLATSWLVAIRIVARPRNAVSLQARLLPVKLSGFRHSSLHSSREVLLEVVQWIGEKIGESPVVDHLVGKNRSWLDAS